MTDITLPIGSNTLTETANWEPAILQWETSTDALGGPSGIMNFPSRQFANRTAYLKNQIESLAASTVTATPSNDPTFANDTSQAASTSWVKRAMGAIAVSAGFSAYFSSNSNYVIFPSWLGGWIIQFGRFAFNVTITQPADFVNALVGSASMSFPIAFPSVCNIFIPVGNELSTGLENKEGFLYILSRTTTNVLIGYTQVFGTSHLTEIVGIDYVAIGK